MRKIRRYSFLWLTLMSNSFSVWLSSRFGAVFFLFGKALRFFLFIVFLMTLFTQTKTIQNYSISQVMFFFSTFTFIDTLTQLFFREVYRFRQLVVTGNFDLILTKPMNPLFRVLTGGADPLDLLILPLYLFTLIFFGRDLAPTIQGIFLYILLVGNGFLIATGFHILVLALAIVTTEIDHAIMMYRDLTNMARIPVDIYREPVRSILTFVIPVGIMMTFPAKALMALLSPIWTIIALLFGGIFFTLCINVWRFALTRYSSASS